MATYLIRKLENFTKLSPAEKQALEAAAAVRQRHLRPREDVIREGDPPKQVNLILDGWACRYKTLEDGRRQIMAFLVPGDLCDLRMSILQQMDHSLGAITPLRIAEIPSELILELAEAYPRLSRALWWNSLVDEAISREWTTNVGQREAIERLAHLFCELFLRLRSVGLTDGPSFDLPATQEQLGEATGMSTVHVNRTLQALRDSGLIVLRGKLLTIPSSEALQQAALFDPNYLHLSHEGRNLDANEG